MDTVSCNVGTTILEPGRGATFAGHQWNPHVHSLVSDGVFFRGGDFVPGRSRSRRYRPSTTVAVSVQDAVTRAP
ncbi:MAG: hypothetical protein ABFS86_05755 [Planctomycetota bacterium]